MNYKLMEIIQEELCVGAMNTLPERLYKKIFAQFAEIKSDALKELMAGIKKERAEAAVEIEHLRTMVHSLQREINKLKGGI